MELPDFGAACVRASEQMACLVARSSNLIRGEENELFELMDSPHVAQVLKHLHA
jgi:hypothetical protein